MPGLFCQISESYRRKKLADTLTKTLPDAVRDTTGIRQARALTIIHTGYRHQSLFNTAYLTGTTGGGFGGEYRLEPGAGVDGEAVQQQRSTVLRHEDGRLGYCWMHHFKRHSARTCFTWAAGGPIETDETSHKWQDKNSFGEEE